MSDSVPLPRSFYDRDVVTVARELLGKILFRVVEGEILSGRIVESEAYLAVGDPACHGSRGKTRRNASIFGPPGHAYVYAIHSRWCLNTVADQPDLGCAALIRAIEPLRGISRMQEYRGTEKRLDLARGPGRLCEALAITRQLDGWDLTLGERLWIAEDAASEHKPWRLGISARIGVTSAHDLPLRFFVDRDPFVSGPKKHHSRDDAGTPERGRRSSGRERSS